MNAIQESILTLDRFHTIDHLLTRGDKASRSRAEALLEETLAEQVTDENHISFGQFPSRVGGPTGDLNKALVHLPPLFELRERHASHLPPALAERLETAIRRALDAAHRRWDEELFDLKRDYKTYSNIFLHYIHVFILAGRYLNDDRLARVGTAQWKRWFNHVAYFGIDEFVSDYYGGDFEALTHIRERSPDAEVRDQATRVLDSLAAIIHAVTHPVLKIPVCGASRSYRRFLPGGSGEGSGESRIIEAGKTLDLNASDLAEDLPEETPGAYRPPRSVVRSYRHRTFPYSVSGRAGITPFRFQSWQDRRAALGSMTGGNYFWQQIHCMAAVGNGPDDREVLFMPGSYSIANGYVCQRENRALCLFSRRPNTYLRTQKCVPDSEIPAEFGDFGIGVSNGWKVAATPDRTVFSARGYRVVIDPFVVKGTTVKPVVLEKKHRSSLSQGRFHRTRVEMTEYVFPEAREWFGCRVELISEEAELPPPPDLEFSTDKDRLNLRDASGLSLALHLNPAGGDVELYDEDWRTLPLLESDRYTLRPGELITKRLLQNLSVRDPW